MNLKGKSLLVFGSRTLDDGRIEEALATFVEQNNFKIIVTALDPKGVCERVKHYAKTCRKGIVLVQVGLDKSKAGGMHEYRSMKALIGDFQKYGMTQGQYREAKARLERYGIATFRTTSRGTIAKLTDTSVFDSNLEPNNKPNNEPTTTEQRAHNEPTTTNKNEKKGKKDIRRFQPPTIDELQIYFTAQGCSKPATEAQAFLDHYASNGWKVGGKAAMKDWKAAVRNWIRRDAEKTPPAKNDQELFKGYAL